MSDEWRLIARDLAWSLTGEKRKTLQQYKALTKYDAAVRREQEASSS